MSKLVDSYFISLPDRKDRQDAFTKRFAGNVELWPGVIVKENEIQPREIATLNWDKKKQQYDHAKYVCGTVGCRRAHLGLMRHWLETTQSQHLLIMEDDCMATDDTCQRITLDAITNLPLGWIQVYFGGSVFGKTSPIPESNSFLSVVGVWGLEAVLYSRIGVEAASKSIQKSSCEIDHWMSVDLHPRGKSYIVNPPCWMQDTTHSSIRVKSHEKSLK